MDDWKILTLVGEDSPGIVARVTGALYRGGWNLGETSMIRLGSNFTIMMMISGVGDPVPLLQPVADEMHLQIHVAPSSGGPHQHIVPNVEVRVSGADRAGIVAQVTTVLAATGFNILELESDVVGSAQRPVYIMHIQGHADASVESLEQALRGLGEQGVEVQVAAIETLIG